MSIRARAWIALMLPPISWFLFEQGLSAALHANCGRAWTGVIWGAASLIVCVLAGRIGWRLRRPGDVLADLWLARLAILGAAIFALAIAFQTLAILMVPPCVG